MNEQPSLNDDKYIIKNIINRINSSDKKEDAISSEIHKARLYCYYRKCL